MNIMIDGYHFYLHDRWLILGAAVASIALLFGMTGAWIGAYWGARRGGRKAMLKALALQATPRDAVQAEQLTRSVDAMALEVERIAEAQRFLVKLLSEREAAHLGSIAPPQSARVSGSVTPH